MYYLPNQPQQEIFMIYGLPVTILGNGTYKDKGDMVSTLKITVKKRSIEIKWLSTEIKVIRECTGAHRTYACLNLYLPFTL